MIPKDFDYIINHLGEERERYFNAISPPIIQTSNFAFQDIDDFRKAITNELASHIYTRGNNPTVAILRKKLAALERTEDCLVFSSGSAAIAAAVMSHAKQGDHIVCVRNPYSWTQTLLESYLSKYGVAHTFVDGSDLVELEKAIKGNTTILFLESPNTADFGIQDLRACAALAQKYGLVSMIDNSYCSPFFQNPADFGIDVVIHSGTKYLNGHSDVVVGVVCSSSEIIQKIFHAEYMTLGAILGPQEAAMVIRGLRTLKLRMERVESTTQKVIEFLKSRTEVERIIHPFEEDHPGVEIAKSQMRGCGGLFSILIRAENRARVEAFVRGIKHFTFAVSWGGHESLILPFVALFDVPNHPQPGVPWNLVRLYIGLEEADFLIKGLQEGFNAMSEIEK